MNGRTRAVDRRWLTERVNSVLDLIAYVHLAVWPSLAIAVTTTLAATDRRFSVLRRFKKFYTVNRIIIIKMHRK